MSYELPAAAAAVICERTGRDRHDVGVVLGSGLSDYADSLDVETTISYRDIPHFPTPGIQGHGGRLVSARVGQGRALVATGRVHTYEGWDLSDVVFSVRTMALAGCHTVLLTNASGGIDPDLTPGDLVTIRDHINLTAHNPLVGPNDSRLGPRFPDLSSVYATSARDIIAATSASLDMPYSEGVYAWWLGPSYETPAEIEMLRRLGADMVGMSTVPEAIALAHMGVRVAGISLVTNPAAGMAPDPPSHDEVTAVAVRTLKRFRRLADALLPALAVKPT